MEKWDWIKDKNKLDWIKETDDSAAAVDNSSQACRVSHNRLLSLMVSVICIFLYHIAN